MANAASKREGRFKCRICRMVFESKEELKLHMMEDHGEK